MSRHIGIFSNNDIRVKNTLSRDTNVLVSKIVMIYDYIITLPFLSGMFLMIAMARYIDKLCCLLNYHILPGESWSYLDEGFYLDIGAWLAAWIAGGFFIAAKCLTKNKVNSS
jgi:hypothetical protein